MNEPIISPWFFYFVGMTTPLIFITGMLSIIFIVITFIRFAEERPFKQEVCIACLLLSISVLIPSESTCYKMLLAQNVTRQTLVTAGETLDAVIDKAVEKIIKIQNGGNSR